MGIIEFGNGIIKWLNVLAPVALVIVAIMFVAAMTRGYRGLIIGIKDILGSKYSFLFFIIVFGVMIYFWLEFKRYIGW
jgi:hypothetical protein